MELKRDYKNDVYPESDDKYTDVEFDDVIQDTDGFFDSIEKRNEEIEATRCRESSNTEWITFDYDDEIKNGMMNRHNVRCREKNDYARYIFLIIAIVLIIGIIGCIINFLLDVLNKSKDNDKASDESYITRCVVDSDGYPDGIYNDNSGMLLRSGAYDFLDESTIININDVEESFPYYHDLDHSSFAKYACINNGAVVDVIRFENVGNYEWALVYDGDNEYWICSKDKDNGNCYLSELDDSK